MNAKGNRFRRYFIQIVHWGGIFFQIFLIIYGIMLQIYKDSYAPKLMEVYDKYALAKWVVTFASTTFFLMGFFLFTLSINRCKYYKVEVVKDEENNK